VRKARHIATLPADVRLNIDVIVTWGTPATKAAKNASASVPIVMAASAEPVTAGLVSGLARPGGNVTGLVMSG
jgi:putative ABC transport system substrate-binding protein